MATYRFCSGYDLARLLLVGGNHQRFILEGVVDEASIQMGRERAELTWDGLETAGQDRPFELPAEVAHVDMVIRAIRSPRAIPPVELSLALAVLQGDMEAAALLADKVLHDYHDARKGA